MMLYQLRPDLLPQGCMTDIERGLWSLYYEERMAQRQASEQKAR